MFTGNLTVTDAFYAGSLETLLTPKVIAPSNADLALRNYGNIGGLSVSNLSGKVVVAIGLTLGGGIASRRSTPAAFAR